MELKRKKQCKQVKMPSAYLLILSIILLFTGCYSPESYDTKKYLEGTGYDDANKWLKDFIQSAMQQEKIKGANFFPPNVSMVNVPPPKHFRFKEPSAILFEYSTFMQGRVYHFIKLPNVKAANSLTEAKALIYMNYEELTKEEYRYNIYIYDLEEKYMVGTYNIDAKSGLPGVQSIVYKTNELFSYPQFVTDSTDCISSWRSYLKLIGNLGYKEPGSNLSKSVFSTDKISNPLPDTLKLAKYTRADIKAVIGRDGNLKLTEYACSPPKDRDWLFVICRRYNSEHLGNWVEVWSESGRPTGNAGISTKDYYEYLFINGKDGSIVTRYSPKPSSGGDYYEQFLKKEGGN